MKSAWINNSYVKTREGQGDAVVTTRHHRRGMEIIYCLLLGASSLVVLLPSASAVDKVVLQLRWDHQFQFAGYYAADWQGYYADANLDVEIRPAIGATGEKLRAIDEVAAGRADFGIAGANLLLGLDAGIPLRLLASIFQTDPTAWYALPDANLHHPADLLRLRVLSYPGSLAQASLWAMLRAEGLDPNRVTTVKLDIGNGLALLVDGEVDVIPGYTLSTPLLLRQQGLAFQELHSRRYGVDFYGDSLFTHQDLIHRDPDLVNRFTRASLAGWRYALEHAQLIAERISRELPRSLEAEDVVALNHFQADQVRDVTLYPVVEVGHINPARWAAMYGALLRAGLVSAPLDPDVFIYAPERLTRQAQARTQRMLLLVSLALLVVALLLTFWHALRRQADRIRLKALAESETRLRQIIDLLPHMVFVRNAQGHYLLANRAQADFYGISVEELLERSVSGVMTRPEDRALVTEEDKMVLASGERQMIPKVPLRNARGDIRLLSAVKIPFAPVGDTQPAVLGVSMDVTDEHRNRQRLRLLAGAIQQLDDAICITEAEPLEEPGPRIVFVNPAFQRITGYRYREVVGRSPRFLQGPKSSQRELQRVYRLLAQRRPVQAEVVSYTKNGKPFWMGCRIAPVSDSKRRVTHYVAIARDVTAERLSRRRVEHQATHDPLTGLANRSLLMALVADAIARHQRHGQTLALLFIDLDRFKPVNDTLGHEAGDQVLREVAKRLRQSVRQSDTVARLGGDEFAVLLDRLNSLRQAELVAGKILQRLRQPFSVTGQTVRISASIGISGFPRDGATVEALLRHADDAMYRVKQSGRDGFDSSTDSGINPGQGPESAPVDPHRGLE